MLIVGSLLEFFNNSDLEFVTSFNAMIIEAIHIVKSIPADKDIVYQCNIAADGNIPCAITNAKEMFISTEGEESIYANRYSTRLFANFRKCHTVDGLELIDTSNVEDMSYMFMAFGGKNPDSTHISGLEHWNTSNVRNMTAMFTGAGCCSRSLKMDVSHWNVSNVTDMYNMFDYTGTECDDVQIGDLSNWNVSGVKNMNNMFYQFARQSTKCHVGNISKWDVSNCILMHHAFDHTTEELKEMGNKLILSY